MTTEPTPAAKTAAAIDRVFAAMKARENHFGQLDQKLEPDDRYKRMAVTRRKNLEKKFADRRHRVKILFEQGLAQDLIAEKLGLTYNQVKGDLEHLGLGVRRNPDDAPPAVTTPLTLRIKDRQDRAVKLRNEGWTVGAIAEELGSSATTIGEDLKRAGVPGKLGKIGSKSRQRVEARQLEVKRLYSVEGMYIAQIAEELGWSQTTIQQDITALGLGRANGEMGRTAAAATVNTVTNAVTHMRDMATVVLQQDLHGLESLDPERKQELLRQLDHIGRATRPLRRILKEEGNTP